MLTIPVLEYQLFYQFPYNVIFDLQFPAGTSSLARGLTGYVDSLMGDRMAYALRESFPINIDFLAPYPDFLAFLFVLLVAAFLSVGVKESSWLNIVFTTVNMLTILVMIVAGAIRCKLMLSDVR